MKIIVCGAGQVGLQIAKHLSDERLDVIVIDKSSDLIKKVIDLSKSAKKGGNE